MKISKIGGVRFCSQLFVLYWYIFNYVSQRATVMYRLTPSVFSAWIGLITYILCIICVFYTVASSSIKEDGIITLMVSRINAGLLSLITRIQIIPFTG